MLRATFVIIGGGIAGYSCAEGLDFLAPDQSIILITASPTVKQALKIADFSELISEYEIRERTIEYFNKSCPNVKVVQGVVKTVQPNNKLVKLKNGIVIEYEKLCICSGAKPKLIIRHDEHVIALRDTDSVNKLKDKISKSRKVVIIGNGGIATELVYKIEGMEVVWAIKDNHIASTFIDPGAAKFFEERIHALDHEVETGVHKRSKFAISDQGTSTAPTGHIGAALGPDWHKNITLHGLLQHNRSVTIEYNCELKRILPDKDSNSKEWPIYVELTNGKVIGCDFIISAIGVEPNVDFIKHTEVELAEDGGIKVDWRMESTEPDIYAAGDACTANWRKAEHWFQMRLWTQAKHMGSYAAKSMHAAINNDVIWQDIFFDIFTHVTSFFGMKVILLGLCNGQRLHNYEVLLRVTKGREYVKIILQDGKIQGAVLIGETGLEEMCENLILNQLDISDICDGLLDPDIDVDDYFD